MEENGKKTEENARKCKKMEENGRTREFLFNLLKS